MAKESVGYKLQVGVTDAKKGIKELNKALGETKLTVSDIGNAIKKAFGKETSFIGTIKSIKSLMETMMKASEAEAEYVESMNLLAVAYRKDTKEGEKLYNQTNDLIDSMERLLGLDPAQLTQEIGIYKQMTSAMGMTNEQSALLSENLIKLQQDTASLYNLQSSEVTTKFQSALAGQTRAVRSLGVDITQATLQQELYNLGIDKSYKELNRASKTMLIYISMQRQLTNANGDASRTINSMANQMKIFKEQVAIAGRQIGAIFIPILQQILPIANAILMVFNDIMEIILGIFGVDVQTMATEFGQKTVDIGDDFLDMSDNIESATKNAKKLLGLRGFDKLNNITTPQDTGSSSSGGVSAGGGLGNIDSGILNALKEYDLHLDEVKNKARAIADWIEQWLIYTDETGKHLTPLGKTLAIIAGATILGKIINSVTTIIGILKKLGLFGGQSVFGKVIDKLTKIAGISTTIGTILTTILGVIGGITMALSGFNHLNNAINDILQNGLSINNALENTLGIIGAIGGSALVGFMLGGGVGLAIGAIVGEIAVLGTTIYKALVPAYDARKEAEEFTKQIQEFNGELDKTREKLEQDRDAKLENAGVAEKWWQQLQSITDENGKITEGFEGQADILKNYLNKELGTTIEIQNGQIVGYQKIGNEIDNIIKKKKAQIYLEAQEELYKNALLSQQKVLSNLYYSHNKYEAKLREVEAQEKSGIKVKQKDRDELEQLKLAYESSADEYSKTVQDIEKYEKMYVSFTEEHYGEIEKIANNTSETMKNATEDYLVSSTKALDGGPLSAGLYSAWQKLGRENEEAYVNALAKLDPAVALEIDKVEHRLDNSDLADHFGKLSQKSEEEFIKYLKQYPVDVQTQIVDKMKEKGYKISSKLQEGIDKLKPTVEVDADTGKLVSKITKTINGKKLQITTDANGNVTTKFMANGGFVDKGELFVAREAGAEMVGQINGRTAVANNDQIVQGITNGVMIGVARAMANTGSTKVVIEADSDTEGLMNFITFKQKEKDRQYGL
jgi:hypothetical protein